MKSSRLDTLREPLRDERGDRVLFVSRCLLNENVRYQGGAGRPGARKKRQRSQAAEDTRPTSRPRMPRPRPRGSFDPSVATAPA